MVKQPLEILQQYWGYTSFRPLQEEIIQNALNNVDALALLPTGGGKSLCFQVPALCKEGICLVVSPLIALMKDQVYNLKKRGIPAAAVYSGMSRRELDIVFENACNGGYKFLYLSPERLKTDMALARIKRMNVTLLAVDEAHCISQWGYDFRPPYMQIAEIRSLIPKTPILALTATATPEVVEDIQERLGFAQKKVFQQSFARPNLSYAVLYEAHKRNKLLDILRNVQGTGVVYTRSRGETKEIARFLQENRINADYYHAGLTQEERSLKQEAWTNDKTRIIVSTNAFGMGIDKPEVRSVVHMSLPDNLEAYFQEAGRGGRDGKKSYAVLLYDERDGKTLRQNIEASYPSMEALRHVYRAIGSYTQIALGAGLGESFDFDFQYFCTSFKLDYVPTHAALRLLEQEGWISISDAVSSPAQVQILADRESIYDYQLRHKNADKILKTILRAYPGIQNNLLEVSEPLIAKMANMPVDMVKTVLENTRKEGILDYFPRRDMPQITFLKERVSAENMIIDNDRYNFRKKRAFERVEQAIRYAETRKCRNQQLLAYFGEKDAALCGICDVCTGRNKSELSVDEFELYANKIKEVLRFETLTFEQILEAFSLKRHEMVAKVVNFLIEEGNLEQSEDGLFSWKK